ncbi:MAG: hypothetical protein LBC42_01930 [Puniceicoccales bacterium]|jgi:hypothetical protein|nr:hypothetical protein [Puniceicoccales bacterium]
MIGMTGLKLATFRTLFYFRFQRVPFRLLALWDVESVFPSHRLRRIATHAMSLTQKIQQKYLFALHFSRNSAFVWQMTREMFGNIPKAKLLFGRDGVSKDVLIGEYVTDHGTVTVVQLKLLTFSQRVQFVHIVKDCHRLRALLICIFSFSFLFGWNIHLVDRDFRPEVTPHPGYLVDDPCADQPPPGNTGDRPPDIPPPAQPQVIVPIIPHIDQQTRLSQITRASSPLEIYRAVMDDMRELYDQIYREHSPAMDALTLDDFQKLGDPTNAGANALQYSMFPDEELHPISALSLGVSQLELILGEWPMGPNGPLPLGIRMHTPSNDPGKSATFILHCNGEDYGDQFFLTQARRSGFNFVNTSGGKCTLSWDADRTTSSIMQHFGIEHFDNLEHYSLPMLFTPSKTDKGKLDLREIIAAAEGDGSIPDKLADACTRARKSASDYRKFMQRSHESLVTSEDTSVYAMHGIEDTPNYVDGFCAGRTLPNDFPEPRGQNQLDMNRITETVYISVSPTEWATRRGHIDVGVPKFFDAIHAAGIRVIVDVRDTVKAEPYFDDTSPYCPTSRIETLSSVDIDGFQKVTLIRDKLHGNIIVHFAYRAIADNTALKNPKDWAKLMQFISAVCALASGLEHGEPIPNLRTVQMGEMRFDESFYTTKVLIHCNGGLGRAPTVAMALTMWKLTKAAQSARVATVCDAGNFKQSEVDGSLNVIGVLYRMYCVGIHARSTFGQDPRQFAALRQLASDIPTPKVQDLLQQSCISPEFR